jgi:hypothetical protein
MPAMKAEAPGPGPVWGSGEHAGTLRGSSARQGKATWALKLVDYYTDYFELLSDRARGPIPNLHSLRYIHRRTDTWNRRMHLLYMA